MLEKPELQDELLMTRLFEGYGLHVSHLAFLPIGADVNTAVYRVDTDDGGTYCLKLRRGPFDEMSIAIPGFLGDQGIGQIIAPLRTATGQRWSSLDTFTLTLYPFVEGSDGYAVDLSEPHWVELGAALKRIHTARLPAALRRRLPHETYSPYWRERVRMFQAHISRRTLSDPVAAGLATFMQTRVAVIHELVEGAEQLGQALSGRALEEMLCHADMHVGNLLIGNTGALYLVDWDTAILAPKERDLMFVGSGLGPGWNQARAAAWFYQGYGPTEIDPVALAYYRCERIVQDIAAFCEQILLTTEGGADRNQALEYLMNQFLPNSVVAIAHQSYRALVATGLP